MALNCWLLGKALCVRTKTEDRATEERYKEITRREE